MIKKIFSIRDAKSGLFHAPFYKNAHGEAERDFQTMANDDKSIVSKYPEDFDLYYLGEYEDDTGKFNTLDTPQHVAKAVQFTA